MPRHYFVYSYHVDLSEFKGLEPFAIKNVFKSQAKFSYSSRFHIFTLFVDTNCDAQVRLDLPFA